jgi:hypothetical protein
MRLFSDRACRVVVVGVGGGGGGGGADWIVDGVVADA